MFLNNDLTKKQLKLAKQAQDSIENENAINELVYKLYNITEEEKKIIESSL